VTTCQQPFGCGRVEHDDGRSGLAITRHASDMIDTLTK